MNVLRLQRWMGHHSPAFTLAVYGHLLDGDLGPPLDPGMQTSLAQLPAAGKAASHAQSAKA